MPSTYEEAGTTNRMIIHRKDAEEKNWPEIRKAVADTTDEDTGKLYYPNALHAHEREIRDFWG